MEDKDKEINDTETPARSYTKGFNEGYTIAQHLPDLADELAKAVGDTPRGMGFVHGRDQFLVEKERDRDRRPDWLRGGDGPKGYFDGGKDKDADVPTPSNNPSKHNRDIEPER